MGLFDELKSYITGNPTVQEAEIKEIEPKKSVDRTSLQEKIDEMTPSEVEQVFEEMQHEVRMNYVANKGISRKMWRKTTQYIRRKEGRCVKWGLLGKYIIKKDPGGRICKIHEADAEERKLSIQLQDSSARSRTRENKQNTKVSSDAKVAGASAGESDTVSDRASSTYGITTGNAKIIWECATGDKDCRLNRRSFIKAGDYHMTGGIDRESELEAEFRHAARRAGVKSSESEEDAPAE
ncbi:hypothetical protein ACM16X_16480 [Haloarcula japonica]|uniref:hypothetical protein n=1 Tax=Haloarcula japonica TaxID=29282 RepID=UPI0039F6DC35